MRIFAVGCFLLCCLFVGDVEGQDTGSSHFRSFVVPGGGPSLSVAGINNYGLVVGSYEIDTDQTVGFGGYSRAANGTIGGVGPNRGNRYPTAVNDHGVIAGYYAGHLVRGFIQYANGKVASFSVPGAAPGFYEGTHPRSINRASVITGYYVDRSGTTHGFIRTGNGTITTFDAPGAGTGSQGGTWAYSINAAGTIVGSSSDPNGVGHGYLRNASGTITTFDGPGSGVVDTSAIVINDSGAIAGSYTDATQVTHGFLRAIDGTITTFDAPRTGMSPGGTQPMAMNTVGQIAGFYQDSNLIVHGFLRQTDGTFEHFEAPGAVTNVPLEGTEAFGITETGTVAGTYIGRNGQNNAVFYGFLWKP